MFIRTYHGRGWGLALGLAALLILPLAGTGAALAAPTAPTTYPTDRVADPHQAGVRWYAATGHTLRGSFLTYWDQHGGLAQFGYPITEEFVENGPAAGAAAITVQYFERNRFEHHPENRDPQFQVLLGRLGAQFHKPDPAVPAQANPTSQYFSETGHNVSHTFYAYWQSHGGVGVHGYPISEGLQEVNPIDGKSYQVQYFERSRFELHPENAGTPYEVMLGLLGTQLARQNGYFPPAGPPAAGLRFGHAADFSWIAGQVAYTRIQGGCTFVSYGDSLNVQPIGPGWVPGADNATTADGAYVILYGHLAGPNEPAPMCPAPAYVVDRVVLNTAQ